ncbi:MAG: hypothetical protein IJC43_03800 [Clostridia bacterium]|nr:hypothetical protein [Clostridia bacterium]
MTFKLIKHEFRATRRLMLPLLAALLATSLLTRFSADFLTAVGDPGGFFVMLAGLLSTTYSVLAFSAGFITAFFMAQRFYRSMLGDEGYLSFTLPVSVHQLVLSRLLVAVFWFALSALIEIFAVFAMLYEAGFWRLLTEELPGLVRIFFVDFDLNFTLYALEWAAIAVVMLASGVLMVYASFATGQLFKRNRLLMSFLSFLGYVLFSQTLIVIISLPLTSIPMPDLDLAVGLHVVFLLFLLGTVLYAAFYYMVTVFLLGRKLNLE